MRRNLPGSKLFVFAVLASAPLFLTGCTLPDSFANIPGLSRFVKKPEGPVTLTMWGLWEPKEIMDVVIEEYKTSHPNVSVEYEQRSFTSLKSYKEAVVTRLTEGSAPDIVTLHNSWVPGVRGSLSEAPETTMTTTQFSEMFYTSAQESLVADNKVYGVPTSHDALALIYNRDMFTEAGITTPPTTWEEFRVAAAKLTKRDPKLNTITQAGAAIGTANNIEHFSDVLGLLLSQAGVAVPQEITDQRSVDVFKFYTNFALEDKVWSDVLPSSVEAFADKKVAMIFAPSWQVLSILGRSNQLNIGVAAVPRAIDLEGNKIEVDWATFWVSSVSKNSQSAGAAWDFLNFISQPEQQRKLYSEASKVRVFGTPYSNKTLQSELSGSAYLYEYVKTGDKARSGIFAAKSGNDKEVDALKSAVNAMLTGSAEPAEILTELQKAVTTQ